MEPCLIQPELEVSEPGSQRTLSDLVLCTRKTLEKRFRPGQAEGAVFAW